MVLSEAFILKGFFFLLVCFVSTRESYSPKGVYWLIAITVIIVGSASSAAWFEIVDVSDLNFGSATKKIPWNSWWESW